MSKGVVLTDTKALAARVARARFDRAADGNGAAVAPGHHTECRGDKEPEGSQNSRGTFHGSETTLVL